MSGKINLIKFDVIDSTNNYIKMNYESLPNLTVVYADEQTAGRGRLGKSFHSPKGTGLYFSLLLKDGISRENLKYLTVMTAVAVMEELKKYTDRDVKIKWVNDIYIDGKKVCGILTESSVNPQTKSFGYAVIGIGINLKTPENGFPDEISDIVTSVFEKDFDEILKITIISNIVEQIRKMLEKNDKTFIESYRKNSFLDGKKINIINENFVIGATALNIDENCNLIAKTDEKGEIVTLFSGDVSVKTI